jgi:hypothetical protein
VDRQLGEAECMRVAYRGMMSETQDGHHEEEEEDVGRRHSEGRRPTGRREVVDYRTP